MSINSMDDIAVAALNNIVVDGYAYFDGDFKGAIARAERLTEDPDQDDVTQLHAVADFLDIIDIESGMVGQVQMQRFLRGLAARIENGEVGNTASQ